MINLISSLIFLVSFVPPNNLNNCKDIDQTHPVRSDIMLQVVLKSYGFYQGNIDGIFGNNSKKALITFQSANNIKNDGIIGSETCSLLKNKKRIIKNTLSTDSKKNITLENKYSQEIYDAQIILKKLGLYSSDVDGLNGPGTRRALKNFQSKAGLNTDGVLGPLTKSALDKGEDSYVTVTTSTPVVDTETKSSSMVDQSSALDFRNYDPAKTCIVGYVDINGVWVPDPCFKPVFVYRFGKTAQVNSQQELDAYLADRWSLQKEKTYTTIGRVKTENYTDGVNSPVNGLIMPSNANNSIVIGIKNDNNVRARPQSGPKMPMQFSKF